MNMRPTKTILTAILLLFVPFFARRTESHSIRHRDSRSFTFNPTAFCKHAAPYKNLCTKVVHTTHGLDMTSPVTVVKANVDRAAQKALHALAEVSFLTKARKKNYPGTTSSVLHSCRDNYNLAATSLHKTQRILARHGSHDDLMDELTAASTFVGTCTDDLRTVPKMKYPIQSLHTNLEHHITNCLDLAAVVKLN